MKWVWTTRTRILQLPAGGGAQCCLKVLSLYKTSLQIQTKYQFKVLGDFMLDYGVNPDRNTSESHSSNCLFPPNEVIMAVMDELMNAAHKIETAFTKFMHHRHLIILYIIQSVITCSQGKLYTTARPKCLTCTKPGKWKRGKIMFILRGTKPKRRGRKRGSLAMGLPGGDGPREVQGRFG